MGRGRPKSADRLKSIPEWFSLDKYAPSEHWSPRKLLPHLVLRCWIASVFVDNFVQESPTAVELDRALTVFGVLQRHPLCPLQNGKLSSKRSVPVQWLREWSRQRLDADLGDSPRADRVDVCSLAIDALEGTSYEHQLASFISGDHSATPLVFTVTSLRAGKKAIKQSFATRLDEHFGTNQKGKTVEMFWEQRILPAFDLHLWELGHGQEIGGPQVGKALWPGVRDAKDRYRTTQKVIRDLRDGRSQGIKLLRAQEVARR